MKTLRLALVATFVALTLMSLANADGFKGKPKKVVNITIDKALQDPGLEAAMYRQVDPSFLKNVEQLYVVDVVYNWTIYRIMGSRQSWFKFFKARGKHATDAKAVIGSLN
jgi:hypothetical protein